MGQITHQVDQQQTLLTGGSPYAKAVASPFVYLSDLATRDEIAHDYLRSLMGIAADNPRRIAGPLLERLATALYSVIQNPEMGRDIAISALRAGHLYQSNGDQTHVSNESPATL